MSSLFLNDLVVLINKRVLRNIAISMDHAAEYGVQVAMFMLDAGALACPQLETWLGRGLEHPTELISNAILPVPRALYATTNGGFSPAAGSDDLGSLVNHLQEFDEVAAGPVDATLAPGDTVCGMPFDIPCPISFKRDPGRRFTFLRSGFLQDNAPEFIEITSQGIRITLQGTAFRGDFFSTRRALKQPTHQFTMRLLYEAEVVESDVGFGTVPFQMVASPPGPSAAGLPTLPPNGSYVFAERNDDVGGFLIPRLTPFDGVVDEKGCDEEEGCQPKDLEDTLFKGQADDLIFDDDTPQATEFGEMPVPRYRVEPRDADSPEKLVIRRIGNPTILAEARAGRLALRFVKVDSLEMTPLGFGGPVSGGEVQGISKSITKINPTLGQALICALEQDPGEGQDAAQDDARQLQLLGPRGLDLPLLPQNLVVAVEARIITTEDADDIQDGFAVNSIRSGIAQCSLTTARYFASADPAQQLFGMSGKVGGTGDPVYEDFSDGSDLAFGASQVFLQPMLDKLGHDAMKQMQDQGLPGLDADSLDFSATLGDGHMAINITGEGEIVTPSPLPNIPYEFTADLKLHMRAQKAVVMGGEKKPLKPVDRFGCVIPAEALEALKLDVVANRLELPNAQNPGGVAGQNPFCFQTYWDPGNGIACFDKRLDTDGDLVPDAVIEACPQAVRVPPPVLDDLGVEQEVLDPEDPPNICPKQKDDDPAAFGQASFDLLPESIGLKYAYGLMVLPPGDDDVSILVDVDEGLLFLLQMLGIMLGPIIAATVGALGGPGLLAMPFVTMGLLTAITLLPFSSLIASVAVTVIARDKLKDKYQQIELPGLEGGSIFGIHLREPEDGHSSYLLQSKGVIPGGKGAFILRNHVVIQSADIPKGL